MSLRHYEVVMLYHPDQSDQTTAMVKRYTELVTEMGGVVHRVEDWGKRTLAYMINKIPKAHYFCLNIECDNKVIAELEERFKLNDACLRHMIAKTSAAPSGQSIILKANELQRDEARRNAAAPVADQGRVAAKVPEIEN